MGQVKKEVTMGFLKTRGKPPDRYKRRQAGYKLMKAQK